MGVAPHHVWGGIFGHVIGNNYSFDHNRFHVRITMITQLQ